MNTLYYGDNLNILRDYIKDESVDLIYLDPPFNSNRNYNVLFKNETGTESESQITAFEDTWHWNLQAEQTYNELINQPDQVGRMIESFRQFIGQNQMMAYLVMMAVRLKELHRVLKPTGSLYLHCDPTASHYLKILLDTIFSAENFKNEIVWQRTATKGDAKGKFGAVHDIILFYTRTSAATMRQVYLEKDDDYFSRFRLDDNDGRGPYRLAPLDSPNPRPNLTYQYKGYAPPSKGWRVSLSVMEALDADGRLAFPKTLDGRIARKHYLHEQEGRKATDVWTDITPLQGSGMERLGYPTQKPVTLLERIISASSNEGDVVLDPFCGCGTSIAAAQKLNRQWIGIDITHLSVGLQKLRLKDSFGLLPLNEKKSRRDGMFVENDPNKISSSVGATENDAAPTELNSIGDTGYKHQAPTEPKPELKFYRVIGQPEDLEGARELADKDKYGFQWWILPLIGAKAFGSEAGKKEGKKGADGGIDGMIVFTDDNSGKAKRVIVSVKGGGVNVSQIRDLGHVVDREKAAIGIFLTLEKPTKPMLEEAIGKGFYRSEGWNKDYPRIQILTVEEVLAGKQPDLPPNIDTFKKASRVSAETDEQTSLSFD